MPSARFESALPATKRLRPHGQRIGSQGHWVLDLGKSNCPQSLFIRCIQFSLSRIVVTVDSSTLTNQPSYSTEAQDLPRGSMPNTSNFFSKFTAFLARSVAFLFSICARWGHGLTLKHHALCTDKDERTAERCAKLKHRVSEMHECVFGI